MGTILRLVTVATATAALAAACSQPEVSRSLEGEGAAAKIYVALMNTASKNDPEAYKIVAYSASPLDPTSIKFCFDQAAPCQAGTSTVVLAGVAQDAGGKTVFLSEKFIKLSANISFFVVAKDAAGAVVMQSVRVAAKGAGTVTPVTPPVVPPNTVTPPVVPGGNVVPPVVPPKVDPAQNGGSCYKAPDAFTCQVEAEIVRLTNVKRATEGQGALTFEPKLGYVARLWSIEQANRGQISHEWFENGTWGQKYQAEFNAASPARAENVAMNGGGADATSTASAFVEQWWASPGHHTNMVGPYATLGVGVQKAADGSWYGTQDFGN